MRISDWSSDVCSSDLSGRYLNETRLHRIRRRHRGASGLGAATARALAAKGVKVAIFDLQEEKGKAIAAELGGVFCECNVTDDASVDAAFAKAREAHGQERILVNCADRKSVV